MNRMQNSDHDVRLDKLFAAYRAAVPDPGVERRVHARIVAENRIAAVFEHASYSGVWRQICVGATLALTVVMGAFVIPHLEKLPVYSASYVDALGGGPSQHLRRYFLG